MACERIKNFEMRSRIYSKMQIKLNKIYVKVQIFFVSRRCSRMRRCHDEADVANGIECPKDKVEIRDVVLHTACLEPFFTLRSDSTSRCLFLIDLPSTN